MKPKRRILIFDSADTGVLACILRSRGYLAVTCSDDAERADVMARTRIDLLLIGPRVRAPHDDDQFGPLPAIANTYDGEIPTLRFTATTPGSMRELMEEIRRALLRKRGPKKAVGSDQWPVVGKVVGI